MTDWDRLAERLRHVLADSVVTRELALGPLTTYRVGGPARLGVSVGSLRDLAALGEVTAACRPAILVVGRGSNLLVADRGFAGLAVQLDERFAEVEIRGELVRAGAAASLPVLARQTARASLRGFEWAVGVPGSLGGSVRMNAGGHGSDMAASLVRVRIVDLHRGEESGVAAAELDLGYRRSAVEPHQVVIEAELELAEGDPSLAEQEIAEIVRWRRENQPGGQNAGSVFTNPVDESAGRLIEAAGAKGLRLGSAEVSPKHANFFQADAGGSADDVFALMQEVRRRVRAASGVDLVAETRLVGFDDGTGREDRT